MPRGTAEALQVCRDEVSGVCEKLKLVQQMELMGLTGLELLPENDAFFLEQVRHPEVDALRQNDRDALVENLPDGEGKNAANQALKSSSQPDPFR